MRCITGLGQKKARYYFSFRSVLLLWCVFLYSFYMFFLLLRYEKLVLLKLVTVAYLEYSKKVVNTGMREIENQLQIFPQ